MFPEINKEIAKANAQYTKDMTEEEISDAAMKMHADDWERWIATQGASGIKC